MLPNQPTMVLRADSGERLGTGHVFRCLALAQAWQDAGGQAVLAGDASSASLEARLAAENVRLERVAGPAGKGQDAGQAADLAHRLGARWVVVDGYQFPEEYQQWLKDAGLRVLAIDDHGHAGHYPADLVLNQNLGAGPEMYRGRVPPERLLLGPRYALLRREFRDFHGWPRAVPERANKVLVTLGGTDPDNVTLRVIEALTQCRRADLQAVVLVGAGNPRREELRRAAAAHESINIRTNVSDVSGLMAWADVAITAGGTTTYERALMGLPGLIIVLADNQRPVAAAAEAHGLGWNLGEQEVLSALTIASHLCRLLDDAGTRARMAARGPELVDGGGGRRVVGRMLGGPVTLRPVAPEDCRRVWEWANDPGVRAASFSSDPIPWEAHQEWFAKKLKDPRCLFFIVLDEGGEPVGQVRCDLQGREGIISISLVPYSRGQGRGGALIRRACQEVLARADVDGIVAFVRRDNEASRRAFLSGGFVFEADTEVYGQAASRLALRRRGQTQWT